MCKFDHAMLQEIYEQPEAIRRTVALYVSHDRISPSYLQAVASWNNPRGEILIAASGSSRHSGLAAEILFEDMCGLAVDVEYASEYSCRGPEDLRQPSVLVLSQSGETSDTLAALRAANERNQKTLAITNAASSTMVKEAGFSMPIAAGPEKAIPATKSFTCELAALFLLSLTEGLQSGRLSENGAAQSLGDLAKITRQIEESLDAWQRQMQALAAIYRSASSFLYLGRAIHYAIAREGALKLKEVSYVHAEGYPTGELKHGPNALVSDQVPLVVLATVDRANEGSVLRYEKTLQLLADLKAQGATVLALANKDDAEVRTRVSNCVEIPAASEYLLPILEVVPLQLFSYFIALEHGVDVDNPRNLSKSVVETV